MPADVYCAAIIAGGASRRMGVDKSLIEFEGEPLVRHAAKVLSPLFSQVVVVTDNPATVRAASLQSVQDIFPGKGPLGGIHAALTHFQSPTFCVACDLPFLRRDVIEYLCNSYESTFDALAPLVDGRMETLHAIYAPSCLPILTQALESERMPGAQKVLSSLNVRFIEEDELQCFDPELHFITNLNTPDDAARAGIGLGQNSV
jgi:molybdopterin-guanine dinucleotide biosynthesis protein A